MKNVGDDVFQGVRRLDVVDAGRRRSDEAKRRIVAEAFESGISVLTAARRHALDPSQIYDWRQQLFRRIPQGSGFAAVVVTPEVPVSSFRGQMEIVCSTLGAGRLLADGTVVPRLAKYKTDIARMWTCVCDDTPFAGGRAPAALFYYSSNRKGEHSREHLTGYQRHPSGRHFAGYNALYDPDRSAGTIIHAACWAHARRYLFELADIATELKRKPGKRVIISPLALEAVHRFDRIFAIERNIIGSPAAERLAVRQTLSAPLVKELEIWMRKQRSLLSANDAVGKKMDGVPHAPALRLIGAVVALVAIASSSH